MLTPKQCESYRRDGYLLVPDLFSKDRLLPALEAAEQNAYGKSFEAFNAELDANPALEETLIRPTGRRSFGGPRAQFHDIPTGVDAIDRIIEHEPFLDALTQLLDTPDMHYHHGFVYVRNGRLDRGTPKDPWAGFHIDWAKPLLPPHPEWQRYGHIQAWVYLTDNDTDCAPVRVLPGAHRKMATSSATLSAQSTTLIALTTFATSRTNLNRLLQPEKRAPYSFTVRTPRIRHSHLPTRANNAP